MCGRYPWHLWRAAVNAGALTETPLTEIVCPLAPILMRLPLRSEKLGTPWLRMHFENASVELVETELRVVWIDLPGELVAVGTFEAVGDLVAVGELEPHAAMIIAAASRALIPRSRAGRKSRLRWPPSWSLSLAQAMSSETENDGTGVTGRLPLYARCKRGGPAAQRVTRCRTGGPRPRDREPTDASQRARRPAADQRS